MRVFHLPQTFNCVCKRKWARVHSGYQRRHTHAIDNFPVYHNECGEKSGQVCDAKRNKHFLCNINNFHRDAPKDFLSLPIFFFVGIYSSLFLSDLFAVSNSLTRERKRRRERECSLYSSHMPLVCIFETSRTSDVDFRIAIYSQLPSTFGIVYIFTINHIYPNIPNPVANTGIMHPRTPHSHSIHPSRM